MVWSVEPHSLNNNPHLAMHVYQQHVDITSDEDFRVLINKIICAKNYIKKKHGSQASNGSSTRFKVYTVQPIHNALKFIGEVI